MARRVAPGVIVNHKRVQIAMTREFGAVAHVGPGIERRCDTGVSKPMRRYDSCELRLPRKHSDDVCESVAAQASVCGLMTSGE